MVDFEIPWTKVSQVDGSLLKGGGPQIQLLVQTSRGQIDFIVRLQHAFDVESAIRRQSLAAREG